VEQKPKKFIAISSPDLGLPGGRRTVGRRMKDDPNFPQVFQFGNKKYVIEEELEAYKDLLIRRAMAAGSVSKRSEVSEAA
jgi:hypothetical protein